MRGVDMSSLFSCKIYKMCPRKSKIQAAVQNPINSELVEQINDYLDDKYLQMEPKQRIDDSSVDVKPSLNNNDDNRDKDSNPINKPSKQSSRPQTYSKSSHFHPVDDDDDKTDNEEPTSDIDKHDEPHLETADSSIHVTDNSVTASVTPRTCDIRDYVLEIPNMLNLRDDTSGVIRSAFKGSEFWIYYNDKINLNSVMSIVLDVLSASGYIYLEFSRLARTDNAIVFDIVNNDPQSILGGTNNE